MDFIGQILGRPDSPNLELQRWLDLIGHHPNLAAPQPREGINPFTKRPMTVRPTPDLAHVIVEDKQVGTMYWGVDGSPLINVCGEPDVVIPVAQDVARRLGGRFEAGTYI